MKKLLSILLVLLLGITLIGCSDSNSPTAATKNYVNELKASFKEKLSEQMGSTAEALGTKESQAVSDFYDLASDFEATYSNEKIENDTATVDVTIKSYSIVTALTKFIGDYFAWVLENMLASPTKEEQNTKAAELLGEAVKASKDEGRILEATVTVYLNKKEDKWIVDEAASEEAFVYAIIGDINSLISSLGTNINK